MELESQVEEFRKRGLGVAALSYDSLELLKEFAFRRRISFPLLSDPESKVIRAFGLLNEIDYPVGHPTHGVPFPGTFVTDGKGVIRQKAFETRYQERRTAASLLAEEGAGRGEGTIALQNAQFTLRTSTSNAEAAPGQLISLILDFEMAPKMHAYAPGVKGYRPLRLKLDPHPMVTGHDARYPASSLYTFAPLNETVPVFMGSFRVLQDVTILGPPRVAPGAPPPPPATAIELHATLEYQVCSDVVCYAPGTTPLQWTIRLRPLDRDRPPEALRHKP